MHSASAAAADGLGGPSEREVMSDAPVSAVLALRSPGNVFRQPGLEKVNMLAAASNSLQAVFACGHGSIDNRVPRLYTT